MAVVEGERRFGAPPERVYAALIDPQVIAAAVPAVRALEVIDDDHWEAKVKLPVRFAPSLTIRFEVLERRPHERAALRAHGGGADVLSTFDLTADGTGTVMRWRTVIEVSGMLSHFAGPGLEAIAERQAARTLDAVDRSV